MYVNHYQHEYQGKAIIDAYHRDALRAEQLRIAKASRRGLITMVAIGIRTSIASLLITAGQHISQEPVARPDLASSLSDNGVHA